MMVVYNKYLLNNKDAQQDNEEIGCKPADL